MKPVPRINLTCKHCGAAFQLTAAQMTRGRGRFCSVECAREARRVPVERECARCGQRFARKASGQVGEHAYCSLACFRGRGAKPTTYRKRGTRHEHRIVAEQMLGRPLRAGEVVHHRDGNTHNNDPANLEVLPNQAEHARLHTPKGKRVALIPEGEA